jgi:putative restriction endonuclease
VDLADNRALAAAHELQSPLIYFKGMAPGQYLVVAPVFVRVNDTSQRVVLEVRVRLHQQRFRVDVLRAYRHCCAVCALRKRQLVQAAHIVADPSEEGIAAVVNGLALLGIAPDGVVHVPRRVREERGGPMLREGVQGFHGAAILKPARPAEHPDPERLAVRFQAFQSAAA